VRANSNGSETMAISSAMIASTTFEVQGRRIREYKGMVRGKSAATEVLRYGTAVVLE